MNPCLIRAGVQGYRVVLFQKLQAFLLRFRGSGLAAALAAAASLLAIRSNKPGLATGAESEASAGRAGGVALLPALALLEALLEALGADPDCNGNVG